MAQPYWLGMGEARDQQPVSWVALVDVSDSMMVTDMQPDRLTQARWLLEQLTQHWREGDRVGLSVFSVGLHELAPLTPDKSLWLEQLALVQPQMLPLRGSRLLNAVQQLDAQLPPQVGLLVVTDGGELPVGQMPLPLQRPGMLLAMGTQTGGFLPQTVADGAGMTFAVNRVDLARLAQSWGLSFVLAVDEPEAAMHWLEDFRLTQPVRQAEDREGVSLSTGLLWMALLVWVGFWRIRPAVSAVGLGIGIGVGMLAGVPEVDAADIAPWQRAWQLYQQGDHAAALTAYAQVPGVAGLMGQGSSAYRLGHLEQAEALFRQAFRAAIQPDQQGIALYQLGVVLAARKDWLGAVEAWEGALVQDDRLQQARDNLAVARKHLPKRPGLDADAGNRAGQGREGVLLDWRADDNWEFDDPARALTAATGPKQIALGALASGAELTGGQVPHGESAREQQAREARQDWQATGALRTTHAQRAEFYRRLFERESGFAAAQQGTHVVEGVAPW